MKLLLSLCKTNFNRPTDFKQFMITLSLFISFSQWESVIYIYISSYIRLIQWQNICKLYTNLQHRTESIGLMHQIISQYIFSECGDLEECICNISRNIFYEDIFVFPFHLHIFFYTRALDRVSLTIRMDQARRTDRYM